MHERKGWYFVKVFEKEEYADQFINGSLYLNRISFIRKIENSTDGRGDKTEAIALWLQRDNLMVQMEGPGFNKIEITKDDLAGPVSVSYKCHDHLHVYCLYAMYTTGFETIEGNLELSDEEAEELRKQTTIDDKCLKFGPISVIVPADPFLSQVKEVLLRRKQWFQWGLVEYYDDETFHGEINPESIPFKKQKRFSYQKEFRICVDTNASGDDPLSINIGDISHMARKVPSAQLREIFYLKKL